MKKRFLALFLVLTVLLAVPVLPVMAADAVLKVNLPESLPKAGESFEVTVELSGNPGFCGIQFKLGFDRNVMICQDYSTGPMLTNALDVANLEAAEGVFFVAISVSAIKEDGQIAAFEFTAQQDIEDWQLTVLEATGSDENDNDINFLVSGVSLTGEKSAQNNGEANTESENTGQPTTDTSEGEIDNPSSSENNESEAGRNQPDDASVGSEETSESADELGTEENAPIAPNTYGDEAGDSADEPEVVFPDTVGHWSSEAVSKAAQYGLFKGYDDGLFRPDTDVTRAQFVTVLYRMAGSPAESSVAPFTDIANQIEEFRTAIAWAYARGYINGRSEEIFDPTGNLTRQEAMKILYFYAGGVSGLELMLTRVYDDQYSDSTEIAEWAKKPMYWGVYNVLISGTSDHTLSPTATASRAQLAKILVNYVERFEET